MRQVFIIAITLTATIVLAQFSSLAQAPKADQRAMLAEANKLRSQTNALVNARKFDEAAKSLGELEAVIQKLKDSGLTDKDAVIVALVRFVDTQKKVIDRNRPADESKKGETPGSGEKPAEPLPPGGVSFVKDVAPIFARNCQRCHGAQNPRSKFSLNTFAALMKGGERGSDDIVPGKPDESRLVLMLKGDEEPRMPQGNRSLRRDLIATVEKWVEQGAKFDGAPKFTQTSTLADIVPTEEEELKAKVAAMSDSELLELHRNKAREKWAASNPSKQPVSTETEHFLIYGTVPDSELTEVGQWAEAATKDLNRMFGRTNKESVWPGKLTIHVFADRHQYTELGQVVEGRELPPGLMGHHFTTIESSYVALSKPDATAPATLKGLVVEHVAAAYLVALGDSPRWFTSGVGRFLASRSDPKAEIYREYRTQVRAAMADGDDPLKPVVDDSEGATVLGFGLIDFLATQRQGDKGIASLSDQLRQKTATDKALQSVYGVDRKSLTVAWAAFALKRYPVAKKR